MKKLIFILLLVPFVVSAGAGLGLSSARFNMGDIRKGACYDVGNMYVINYGGDESGWYNMSVSYLSNAPERRIPQNWITYTPQRFELQPNEGQLVNVDLCIPHRARKGDYFSYLEAGLETTGYVGIAVATKLYFTVDNRKK